MARPRRGHFQLSITWTNTHLPSLEAQQRFMGAGRIRGHTRLHRKCKRMYILQIADRDNLLRVIPRLLPHAIIKKEKLLAVLKIAKGMRSMKERAPNWGALSAVGRKEIRRLYWVKKLSLLDIANRFGVTWCAVKLFMKRHGIPKREKVHAWKLSLKDPRKYRSIFSKARNAKIAKAQRRLWSSASHRSRMVSAFKLSR